MYKELIDKIVENGTKDDMHKITELTEHAMDHLKKCDAGMYEYIMSELHEIAYGKVLTEEMAHDWVVNMKPYGEHWNKETTDSVIPDNSIDKIEFYAVMNMMYNDYYKVIGDDTNMYVNMTMAWLNDEDGNKEKTYDYHKYII